MTETDRELLELAAKGAGLKITGWDHQVAILDDGSFWQPLYDTLKTDCMGDALRLAAKINAVISTRAPHCSCCADGAGYCEEHADGFGGDHLAAIRCAVVRAAAELGRKL